MATNKKTAAGEPQDKPTKGVEKKEQAAAAAGAVKDELTAESVADIKPKKGAGTAKKAPVVAKRSAKKDAAEEADPEVRIESAINRTEAFLYENGKMLLYILAVIVVVIGGFLSYKYLYLGHKSEKAGEAMFVAEQLFAQDSFALALNGDGSNPGFLDVARQYGSVPQGNVANHYAGVCYLKLGDMDNALAYLAKYKATKGSPNEIINAQNIGLQGDILVQKGEYDKAVGKYVKAVSASDNSFTAPYYLKKLGLAYEKLGRGEEALAAFRRIADQYPSSMEWRDIEKYIGGAEQE